MSILKASCKRSIGLLRMLTCYAWGGDQKSIMRLYRAFIRSKLDYGCQVYGSACPTLLTNLDVISNDCLRIASGCFRTTPIETLHVISEELPMKLRREWLTLKYACKTKSHLSNPAFNAMLEDQYRQLYENRRITPPLNIRAHDLISKYNIRMNKIKNEYSSTLRGDTVPTWAIKPPTTCSEMITGNKAATPDIVYIQMFHSLVTVN